MAANSFTKRYVASKKDSKTIRKMLATPSPVKVKAGRVLTIHEIAKRKEK